MNRITLYCFFFSFIFFACGSSDKDKEINAIKESVESAEKTVNRYDINVQSAIDSKNFQYISVVAKEAADSVDVQLNYLKTLSETSSDNVVPNAAAAYVEALREIIITEEMYSTLSDSLSAADAAKIDDDLYRSSQKAKEAYARYSSLLLEQSPK